MSRLVLAFALALFAIASVAACSRVSNTTLVQRSSVDGVDTLHVETTVVRDVATIACLTSRTGQCRVVVFTRRCDLDVALGEGRVGQQCVTRALGRYELRTGERHAVRGLPKGFEQCSSVETMPTPPECDATG
jgi:hypothetical protein